MNLLKRLGIILSVFCALLIIRTLVAPPHVIIGKTTNDLKAYLCKTDWWDHSFTTMEVLFLVWGIRLCIVVRKAPSEFNESKFISMAIYNEFLLSIFLNISMLFLQSPANPDLLYIIFFCHTQLTVTPLLCLIFGSKAYMVFRGTEKTEESSGMISKTYANKFLNKSRCGNSQYTSTNSSVGGLEYAKISEQDIEEEFRRLFIQLDLLKEKNIRFGNQLLVTKISAMQDAASRISDAYIENNKKCKSEKQVLETQEIASVNQTAVIVCENPISGSIYNNRPNVPTSQNIKPEVNWQWESSSANINNISINEDCTLGEDNMKVSPNDIDDSLINDAVKTQSYFIKSGHAKTHSIIINLDEKSRFTEEVTV